MAAIAESDHDLLARARASAQRLLAELRRDFPTITDDQARRLIRRMETALQGVETQLEKGIA